jgi:hypothetical protein
VLIREIRGVFKNPCVVQPDAIDFANLTSYLLYGSLFLSSGMRVKLRGTAPNSHNVKDLIGFQASIVLSDSIYRTAGRWPAV